MALRVMMNSGGIAMTNSFLVADEQGKVAIICDAPNDTTAELLDEAGKRGWDVVGLWMTHGHFDHMADHEVVKKRFPGAKILIHRLDAPKLADPNSLFPLPFVIAPCRPDELLEDGQKLRVGAFEFEVIHTPGHCSGHVAYYCAGEKVLLGGDLIIGGAIGRTDLPDSDEEQLEESIRRVMRLPAETRLMSGHGEISTLGEERRRNPYVRAFLRE